MMKRTLAYLLQAIASGCCVMVMMVGRSWEVQLFGTPFTKFLFPVVGKWNVAGFSEPCLRAHRRLSRTNPSDYLNN